MRKQGVRGVGGTPSDRHTTYFELRDAAERPGCVVCRLVGRSVRRYLEILSFESVNDLGIRRQLREGRGFCNRHAWALLDEVRDPFGAGIIYRDVLQECVRVADHGDIARLHQKEGVGCPACEVETGAAHRFLDVLAEHAHETDMADRLTRSGGICWRHFVSALGTGTLGLVALARVQLDVISNALQPLEHRAMTRDRVMPAPGIRAGNAAPRPAPDERPVHPALAMLFGMPGAFGGAVILDESGLVACEICRSSQEQLRLIAQEGGQNSLSAQLCPGHAWTVIEITDALQSATNQSNGGLSMTAESLSSVNAALMQLQTLLNSALPQIEQRRSIGFGSWRWMPPSARQAQRQHARSLAWTVDCPLCLARSTVEESALRAHSNSSLCRVHWLQGVTLDIPISNAATMEHWRHVVSDLIEYIRKNDYRFRNEERGPEQRSPWRAIAGVIGGHGVR